MWKIPYKQRIEDTTSLQASHVCMFAYMLTYLSFLTGASTVWAAFAVRAIPHRWWASCLMSRKLLKLESSRFTNRWPSMVSTFDRNLIWYNDCKFVPILVRKFTFGKDRLQSHSRDDVREETTEHDIMRPVGIKSFDVDVFGWNKINDLLDLSRSDWRYAWKKWFHYSCKKKSFKRNANSRTKLKM